MNTTLPHPLVETLWRWAAQSGSPASAWRQKLVRLGDRWASAGAVTSASISDTFWRWVAESDEPSDSWRLAAIGALSIENSAANLMALSALLGRSAEVRTLAQRCLRGFSWTSRDQPEETFAHIVRHLATLHRLDDAPELIPLLFDAVRRAGDLSEIKLCLSTLSRVVDGTQDIDIDQVLGFMMGKIECMASAEELDLYLEATRVVLLHRYRERAAFAHLVPRLLTKFRSCPGTPHLPHFEQVLDLLDVWEHLPSETSGPYRELGELLTAWPTTGRAHPTRISSSAFALWFDEPAAAISLLRRLITKGANLWSRQEVIDLWRSAKELNAYEIDVENLSHTEWERFTCWTCAHGDSPCTDPDCGSLVEVVRDDGQRIAIVPA